MKKWLILFIICLDWSLMWIDFTAVNIALAPIANEFHTNLRTLQWIITAYTLSSASLMAIGGRLGDIYGHKRLFIIGTLIFVITSALAGIADSTALLIAARVGQGIGIAMVVPITTALVYLIFKKEQQALAIGLLTTTTGVAMAIGPTVGGLLITYVNWRWVFYINVPLGMLAIMMALVLIKETPHKKITIDIPGIFTLASGLFCLLLALNKISDWGFSVPLVCLFSLSIFLLYLFIKIEEKSREPLIHLNLLKHRTLMSIISIRTCTQYVFFVFLFFISLYLQNILGLTAERAGYILLIFTIILGVFSPFTSYLLFYFTPRTIIASSCLLIALALLALIFASLLGSRTLMYLSLFLFGAGFSIHFPTTNLSALQTSPPSSSALITGMVFTLAFAGAAAGITLSSTIFFDTSRYQQNQLLQKFHWQLSTEQYESLHLVSSGAKALSSLSTFQSEQLIQKAIYIAERSFVYGLIWVLSISLALTILALLIAIVFLKRMQIHKRKRHEMILEA